MRQGRWTLVLVMGGLLATVGCSGKKDEGGSGAVKVNQDTAKGTVESFIQALLKSEFDTLPALVHPDQKKMAEVVFGMTGKMMKKTNELAAAADSKFGKDVGDKVRKNQGGGSPVDKFTEQGLLKDGKIDWSKVALEEKGDTATVMMPDPKGGRAKPMDMEKVGGKWYILLEKKEKMADMEQGMAMMQGIMGMALQDMDKTIADVKSGKMTKEQLIAKVSRNEGPGPGPGTSPD